MLQIHSLKILIIKPKLPDPITLLMSYDGKPLSAFTTYSPSKIFLFIVT